MNRNKPFWPTRVVWLETLASASNINSGVNPSTDSKFEVHKIGRRFKNMEIIQLPDNTYQHFTILT